MNNLLTNIETIEIWAERQERRARRSVMVSAIIYGVLALFVAGYTLIVVPLLKDLTTPTALGEQAHGWLQTELPTQRRALVDYCLTSSPMWAENGMELVKGAVPTLEKHITDTLDSYTERLAGHLRTELVPRLSEAVTRDASKLKTQYEELKKANKDQEIPVLLATLLDAEMDKYLNNEFVTATEGLQVQLRQLATKPESQLTRREDAQRQAIRAWAVLSEHGDVGETLLHDMAEQANDLFIKYFSAGEDQEEKAKE
ncbi:MAG: hypothetical protein KAI66_08805 [Lentisphaeria bacterium]|nr:hypothetical protein [Lentisphaeria bacterium]